MKLPMDLGEFILELMKMMEEQHGLSVEEQDEETRRLAYIASLPSNLRGENNNPKPHRPLGLSPHMLPEDHPLGVAAGQPHPGTGQTTGKHG